MKSHRNQEWPLIFLAMAGGGEEQLSHQVIIKIIQSSRPTTPCAQKDHQNFFWKPKVKWPQASNKEAWRRFDECLLIILKKVLRSSSDATYFVISSMWKGESQFGDMPKRTTVPDKAKDKREILQLVKECCLLRKSRRKAEGKKGLGNWERSVKGFSTSR